MSDVENMLGELTLEQTAQLGSGAGFWTTKKVGDVPAVSMTDGPHGLRKQDPDQQTGPLEMGASLPATCFPPAVGLSQTWDPAIVRRVGAALGAECQAAGVNVLLGPGVNIKRDPRCGRNFEYYAEDPHLAGALGTAWVEGVQSRGVGASLKHFAANNQEHDRMRVSADIDPRPLREIYLRAFQQIVEIARPWTVMASYNKINGVHAAENQWLLTDVLRGEWGFEGIVVSDWGAVTDRVAAVAAGLDLEMPGGDGASDAEVAAAVKNGTLDESTFEESARRIARFAVRAAAAARPDTTWDVRAHHALAREAAGRAIVLLKNNCDLLPLAPFDSLAVIGEFATEPRFQGGGSSHVNPASVDLPLDEIRRAAGAGEVISAQGFAIDGSGDAAALRDEAVTAAISADVAVVFLGLGDRQESEGFDRDDIELPSDQIELLAAIVAVQPRTVVVLSHGGVLRLAPIVDGAAAILDGGLLGQAGGGAIADVLFGTVNPSGRLTETVPERLEDTPAFTDFPGEDSHVRYGEGLFVGYRWYDQRRMNVTFPFGHGLSYTSFTYGPLRLEFDGDHVVARIDVRNTGSRAGREIVQFYAGREDSAVVRPPKWLIGFAAVDLGTGETAEVVVPVPRRELAYWHEELHTWIVEGGEYQFSAGASSRDIRSTGRLTFNGDPAPRRLTLESSISEVLDDPIAEAAFGELFQQTFEQAAAGIDDDLHMDVTRIIGTAPIGRFLASLGAGLPAGMVQEVFDRANAANGFG